MSQPPTPPDEPTLETRPEPTDPGPSPPDIPASDDDLAVVLCNPIGIGGPVTRGSTVETCSRCGRPVWFSPATRDAVGERTVRFVCMLCVGDEELKAELQPPTPGQIEELLRHAPELALQLKLAELARQRSPERN